MSSRISVSTVVEVIGVVALLLIARFLVWAAYLFVIAPRLDPLRHLPGPDGSAMQNHFREVMDPNISQDTHERWVKQYGRTFRFHGFGKHDYRLMSLDFRAVSHVLNSPVYEKPWQTRRLLARLLGRGISVMEGEEHKIQRKIIAPAFSTQSVKALCPIFLQVAEELREIWSNQINQAVPTAEPKRSNSSAVVDSYNWISRATFDIIGLAGFDYPFRSLQDETEEVSLAYRKMFAATDKGPGLKGLLRLYFPIIERIFPDEAATITKESLRTIRAAGDKLIANKKAAILASASSSKEIRDKDLLSLMIKSNLSENPAQRMSDDVLLDQLSTFLFAGSDSTAVSIAWCLHNLAIRQDIQARLRYEIMSLPAFASISHTGHTDAETARSPSYADTLDALPFLDAVVRETLRLSPPVHGTIRVATADDHIPLSQPTVLRDGTATTHIRIKKGSYVHIPIEGLNTSKDVWGEDAREFNPDRWLRPLPSHPGLASLMTFSYGPHSCPGWKFTLLEAKVFLAVLLPSFKFSPADEISKFNAILTRPYVKGKFELGTRLPVRVERYEEAC
ncbi:cytochrome P450 [Dentipellis sp. KUC8613]|nr:cytochrome P450 [Dentipellis sp. KUC8613]